MVKKTSLAMKEKGAGWGGKAETRKWGYAG
jgi:hypothetical protein